MPGTPCHLCAHPTGDDAPVCTRCAGQCATALRQVPDLVADLDDATGKQTRFGSSHGGRTPRAEVPLPIDPRAAEAAAVLRSALVGWVRVVHGDRGGSWPSDSLTAMAAWLAPVIGWARHADYGPDLVDEILAAVGQARRAVDRPTRLVPLHQSCRAVVLDGQTPVPCGGELSAVLAPGLPADGQVRCSSGDPEHTTTVQAMMDRRRGARLRI
ncbi:hypothetical protein FZ103_00195 [Streptomonospora sp. PA3]|uniref:hypothetical protein n=1 Tax=Streptomonospora sp. PA3 TaxID=2607326 RepID=UPI0012DFE49A|nr:hypothetical protein [Streptomonospora sp. PA3]MUL39614.1 hypothetical protein [Streptomonospora sp. PA3]